VLMPNQKLLLQITPPVTATATPNPATATQAATIIPATVTSILHATAAFLSPTPDATPTAAPAATGTEFSTWLIWIGIAAVGISAIVFFTRKR
jgi:LPXTG-motif cell wall-anchored protein